jgi:hypothetical protein
MIVNIYRGFPYSESKLKPVLVVTDVTTFERVTLADGSEAFHIVGATDEQLVGVGLGYSFEVVNDTQSRRWYCT